VALFGANVSRSQPQNVQSFSKKAYSRVAFTVVGLMNLNSVSTTGFTTGVGQGESLQASFHAPTMRGLDSLPLLDSSPSVNDEKEVGTDRLVAAKLKWGLRHATIRIKDRSRYE
jgi:hypothetical protein